MHSQTLRRIVGKMQSHNELLLLILDFLVIAITFMNYFSLQNYVFCVYELCVIDSFNQIILTVLSVL